MRVEVVGRLLSAVASEDGKLVFIRVLVDGDDGRVETLWAEIDTDGVRGLLTAQELTPVRLASDVYVKREDGRQRAKVLRCLPTAARSARSA